MVCFADINVSQSSVAAYARCDGIFSIHLTTNLSRNLAVKIFLNRFRFDRIVALSPWPHFFAHPYVHTYTHTSLTALCPGLPGWAGTRKVKPIWILLKQETMRGSGISWAICKSAHRSRRITMPAYHSSVIYSRVLFLLPNQQRQSTEDIHTYIHTGVMSGCVSVRAAFVLWAKQELQYFVSVFSGQVFVTKYNLSAVAECVTEATCYCSQVFISTYALGKFNCTYTHLWPGGVM